MTKGIRYVHTEDVHNFKAASFLVPFIIDLLYPKSVLDVGCGTGTWLKVFQDCGMSDICGLDGDYVDLSNFKIDSSKFIPVDLRSIVNLKRRFDVILCLEVAEHLEEEYSLDLINTLINHGDTIIFSAALPFQGGQNHVNEQPPEYWSSKFQSLGYEFFDVIRPAFWQNGEIDWWYRQNMFLVTKDKEMISRFNSRTGNNMYVHPELYYTKVRKIKEWEEAQYSPKVYLKLLLKSTFKRLKK